MQSARAPLCQPYWVYHAGIAFESLMRRSAHAVQVAGGDARWSGGLAAAIASSPDELHAAAKLVESRYAARGYRSGAEDRGLPPGIRLIATDCDAIVGTVTLRLDGPRGLAADEGYGDAIDAVRRPGRNVCELGRLALAEDAEWRPVLSALFGLAHVMARRLHGCTDVFVEVNPRHANFYRKLFGFAVAAGERVCPRVMAPAVLLRLEIARLEARLAETVAAARARADPLSLSAP
jgi:hypothetical protein